MIETFVAIFYMGGAPMLELHNNRTEAMCRRAAAHLIRNVRMPGNLKLKDVKFTCVQRDGRSQ